MTPTDLVLRPGEPGDAAALALVQLEARAAAPMPAPVHTDDEVRAWISGRLGADEVWVAELDGRVVGYARLTDAWLDDLYVAPAHAREGIGSALLDLAKARRPAGFCLWVFEANVPARAFYERHGLVELERTDGAANEEREPDLRLAWPGEDPEPFWQGLLREVDQQLDELSTRRAALARALRAHRASEAEPGDGR